MARADAMNEHTHVLPDGGAEFLDRAGWANCIVDPIPGDASFRRYFRLKSERGGAKIKNPPPPPEKPPPFIDL